MGLTQEVKLIRPEGVAHWVPILKLNSDFSDELAHNLSSMIRQANEQRADAIIIEIDSPGGKVDAGFELAKAMRASKARITCVVSGMAASMAYYTLQNPECTTRLMTEEGYAMIHPVRAGATGYEKDVNNTISRLHVLDQVILRHETKRMKLSYEQVHAKIDRGVEWWFESHEAMAIGAIDAIVNSTEDVHKCLIAGKKPTC
jgi:ATP-dependent Clp protease protease subunit